MIPVTQSTFEKGDTMAEDKMYLVITLRKEVPDREAGKIVFDLVKLRMVDHPEVIITGHVTNHFSLEDD